MRKLFFGTIFVLIILIANGNVGLKADQLPQYWQDDSTIPTRTPTSTPVEPTSPPNNPPPPQTTPTALPTATITTTPLLPPTPAGGYLATAVPCLLEATVLGLNPNFVNVRSGPGITYAAIGQLVYHEVRPIIGRAPEIAWWQIQLPSGLLGWVADEVVQVDGNPVNVPIVSVPLLAGVTVTPGVPWQPTAPATCPTETATAVPVTNTAESETIEDVQVVEPLATVTEVVLKNEPTAQPEPEDEPTATATATPIALATSVPVDVSPPNGSGSTTGGGSALSGSGGASGASFDASIFLLVGAVLMIVLGVAAMVVRQRTA